MKGDLSKWRFRAQDNYTGVLHQQGRVLLDADWNADQQIDAFLQQSLGRDALGAGVLAVPAEQPGGWRALQAAVVAGQVQVSLAPGRGWLNGIHVFTPSKVAALAVSYLPVPLNAAAVNVAQIGAGVRDALVLEVWEEAVSGFQDEALLEAALGGPDTTERVRAQCALRLLRLSGDEDCGAVAARGQDDRSLLGKLSVTPSPALSVSGECPLEIAGGYTGLEHALYRIEIGQPQGGQARFKWSQFNGGLVGRGRFDSATRTVSIEANNQAINHCGLSGFYLEALARNAWDGWDVVYAAEATLTQDDTLALSDDWGSFPGSGSVFFRLWNGVRAILDFPAGGSEAVVLEQGLRLAFEAPLADLSNYRPGDFWQFPVRAAGVALDTSEWPNQAPPQGIIYHRAPLALIEWQADDTARQDLGQIDDCRRVFRPLTQQGVCCSYTVGDGKTSHGDFDSIAEAIDRLPRGGGQVCLLPGVHEAGVTIARRFNVTVRGCGLRTLVVPAAGRLDAPLFRVADAEEVVLEAMDMATLGGTAVHVSASAPGASRHIAVRDNRILACDIGIRIDDARHVEVCRNRVRMLDKAGAGVAIYVQGDDALIERNELGVLPAPDMPPVDTPDGDEPVRPLDPCARLERVYRLRRGLIAYVAQVWGILLPPRPQAPYLALGGIQIAAGAERVNVLENRIEGGAGNGISLGGLLAPPREEEEEGEEQRFEVESLRGVISGRVLDAEGRGAAAVQLAFQPVAGGKTLLAVSDGDGDFTLKAVPGRYTVQPVSPALAVAGVEALRGDNLVQYLITLRAGEQRANPLLAFLYEISIARNRIVAMGGCGIGLAPLPARVSKASALQQFFQRFGNPVVGLRIEANLIRNCLRNPFDEAMRALARLRGLGGISLGLCEDLDIVDNEIEDNGLSHRDPVCGIYVGFGEEMEVSRNRVVGNGPLVPGGLGATLADGIRGGIVAGFASSISLAPLLSAQGQAQASGRPAARIHDNLVDQPAGQALTLGAFGPLSVSDNSFVSEISGPRPFDRLAGTVLIINLGGLQNAAGASQLNTTGADAAPAADAPATGAALTNRRVSMAEFERSPAALRVLPGGQTRFNDNQCRTGGASTSVACEVILALDDLSFSDNQCTSYRSGPLIAQGMLLAGTLRASCNRMAEAGSQTLMSLWTLGLRLNNTTFNHADHCIVATEMHPTLNAVQVGNQVLHPSALCASHNMTSDLMFKTRA